MTNSPSTGQETPSVIAFAELPKARATAFDLHLSDQEIDAMIDALDLTGLRKVRFSGKIVPTGRTDWRLEAQMGATVVQPCVVSLAAVTTRIDEPVLRQYQAEWTPPESAETEMPEDTSTEPLPSQIDLREVLREALALALPQFPRAEGAELVASQFTEPGKTPMSDADAKPFAGLANLKVVARDSED